MKKTIKIKAKRLIASALSTVMCLTVVSSSAFAANDISYDTASASGTAYIVNDGNDDYRECSVTLSVNDFADLASEYGCSVTIGNEDIAEPQVRKSDTVFFTNNKNKIVGYDTPTLPVTVQLRNITFSDNVKKVIVSYSVRMSDLTEWDTITPERYSGHTPQKDMPPITKYTIYMRVETDSPLVNGETAWVAFYWTDHKGELI